MILLIDNYDSFAHNLGRYFRQLGQQVRVLRNDEVSVESIAELSPVAIVISPGPCTPDDAGICLEVIERFATTTPMLGVCLGHQAICQSFGAEIVRETPLHGRSSNVAHQGHELFQGIETPFVAGRYHSLVAEPKTIPANLRVIAETEDGVVMGVAHELLPVYGVQFHPESILTPCGYRLLANFLRLAGQAIDSNVVDNLIAGILTQTEPPAAECDIEKVAEQFRTLTPHPW